MANKPNPSLSHFLEQQGRASSYAPGTGVTTLDSVVQKTAVTLGLLVLTALATWVYLAPSPDGLITDGASTVYSLSAVASISALGLSLFISFSRKPRPAMILLFSVLEGVVIGAFSRVASMQAGSTEPVVGAVMGTVVAFAATLAVYKFMDIQVTARMRRNVMIAMFAFVGVSLMDFVLHFFGASFGFNGFGTVGVLASFAGVAIALFMLIIDFDAVEQAIRYQVPESESWRLAFGLTVTVVWLYVNLLRIFTAFSSD